MIEYRGFPINLKNVEYKIFIESSEFIKKMSDLFTYTEVNILYMPITHEEMDKILDKVSDLKKYFIKIFEDNQINNIDRIDFAKTLKDFYTDSEMDLILKFPIRLFKGSVYIGNGFKKSFEILALPPDLCAKLNLVKTLGE